MDKRKAGLLNNSLDVSSSIIENCAGIKDVEEIIIIICDVYFDAKLFLKKYPALGCCKKIPAQIVRNCWERK